MNMQQWLDWLGVSEGDTGWLYQILAVLLVVLIADLLQRRLLARLQAKLELTETLWDDAVLKALRRPLSLLIWIIGITFVADIVAHKTQAAIFAAIGPIRNIGVICAVTWFISRLITEGQENIVTSARRKGAHVDTTTVGVLGKLLRISVFITSGLVMLQTLGYSISGVLAFGGIGGLAVGLAAKDLLANFFGGLMVFLDRPFTVGDQICSPDKNIEGTVEEIGWRQTKIRTPDMRPLYVPNATFTTIAVINSSRMTHRRIQETIGLRYQDADRMGAIVSDAEAMLRSHPDIDQNQNILANFNAFAPSSLDFLICAFTRSTSGPEYQKVRQDVLLRIHDIIARHGAQFAFPTTTVHVADDEIRIRQLAEAQ